MDGRGRGWWKGKKTIFTTLPLPLSLFLITKRPLGANFFLSPALCCHENEDGSHNFRYENTELSLAKIIPALQASHPLGLKGQ